MTWSDRPYILLNRLAWALQHTLGVAIRVLEELPVVVYQPGWASRAVFDRFDHTEVYERAETQLTGLYPFERRMLERYFPAPPARLLAHGIGGGRELLPLLDAGYDVEAYEPSSALAAAAGRLLQTRGAGKIRSLSAQQWAREASGAFDGVFTGWGMWAHMILRDDRLAVLRAFRRVCPSGPVLLSFHRWEYTFNHREVRSLPGHLHARPQGRLMRLTREGIRERLLRLPPIERGTGWHAGYFYHLTEEEELREEASEAGYEVAYWEKDPLIYPHAVLLPNAPRSTEGRSYRP